jgi:alkylation response protein AidB-like acyl-CoA dehydrogenase
MDFAFSNEQEMLGESVARLLAKTYDFDARQALVRSDAPWSAQVWAQFAELGLLALPFPEEKGGLGGSTSDFIAFAQSLGRHLVLEPYVHSILLAGGALAASESAASGEWLERLIAGEAIAAFAFEESHGTATPDRIAMRAETRGESVVLTGEKRLVIAGAQADVLVVAARDAATGRVGLYLVEQSAAGLAVSPYITLDGRSAANLRFDASPALAVLVEDAAPVLEDILSRAIIVAAGEAVGAMGALVALTGEYATTRKQFGQPIAAFQAVAHRLADMKIAHAKALSSLLYTTALADSGALGPRDIAVLKGQTGKLGRAIGEAAIQIHGGVGMTDELSVSHYHKRILTFDAQLGESAYHLRRIGAGV